MSRASLMLSNIVVMGALLVAIPAYGQATGISLDIQPGARENAMGAAGVGLIRDPSEALWWNPAGLAFARVPSGQFTYARLLPGFEPTVRYYHAAGALAIPNLGGVGLGGTYLDYGKDEWVDAGGNVTGVFVASEISMCAGGGLRFLTIGSDSDGISCELAAGANVKWIRIKLTPYDLSSAGNAWAADLGVLGRVHMAPATASLGMRVANVGPEVEFPNENSSAPLNRNLRVGIGLDAPLEIVKDFVEAGVALALDWEQSLVTDEFRTYHGGMEGYGGIPRMARLSLRLGYYHDKLGDIRKITYGTGIRVVGLALDWASVPQATGLRRVNKFTAGFHFDPLIR